MELNDAQMQLILNLLTTGKLFTDEDCKGGFLSKETLEVLTREALIGEIEFFIGGQSE